MCFSGHVCRMLVVLWQSGVYHAAARHLDLATSHNSLAPVGPRLQSPARLTTSAVVLASSSRALFPIPLQLKFTSLWQSDDSCPFQPPSPLRPVALSTSPTRPPHRCIERNYMKGGAGARSALTILACPDVIPTGPNAGVSDRGPAQRRHGFAAAGYRGAVRGVGERDASDVVQDQL